MKRTLEEAKNQIPKFFGRNAAEKPAQKDAAKKLKPGMHAPPAIIGLLIGLLLRLLFEVLR